MPGDLAHGHGHELVSLDAIRQLMDVPAINRLLQETIARERLIDSELERLLSQRHDLESQLGGLQNTAEVLELVRADSEQMASSVSSTCALAERVSVKVRELDVAQSRVHSTIVRISAILDRSNCIDGVKSAMQGEDYEAAARYIETFLELDNSAGGDVMMDVAQAAEQREMLLRSKRELEEVVRQRFAKAAEQGNHEGAVRFAKLFGPLGLKQEGLTAFVQYLRARVAVRAREDFSALTDSMQQQSGNASFVSVLSNLFMDIALAIEDNDELLRSMFGEEAVLLAIKELQAECDVRGAALLRRYMESRHLAQLVKDISAQRNERGSGAYGSAARNDEAHIDPRELEGYLEEMLMLSQRSEEYNQFMLGKVREVQSSQVSPSAPLSPRGAVNSLRTGAFNRAVQELVGFYLSMEEFFLLENVLKAIRIDEAPVDALTSSMVDDVFFILQKCATRAVSTANTQCMCALLNHVTNVLGNEFRTGIQRKFRSSSFAPAKMFAAAISGGQPSSGLSGAVATIAAAPVIGMAGGGVGGGASDAASAEASAKRAVAEVCIPLNNVDVACEYVLKFKHKMEEFCAEMFVSAGEREKVKSCLGDLLEVNGQLKQLLTAGLEQVVAGLMPLLRPVLDTLVNVKYVLDEEEYAENEVNDPWVQRVLAQVDMCLEVVNSSLTSNCLDALVHLVIDAVVLRLEAIVTQKKFNQLGGLQMDRDVRALVGHFSGLAQRTVRDKFARLTQVRRGGRYIPSTSPAHDCRSVVCFVAFAEFTADFYDNISLPVIRYL
eukprot:jgi/Mesvir1/3674/Mv14963-RA.2